MSEVPREPEVPPGDRPQALVNLRDVGGLPVTGGGRTRRGVLYRSDAPYPGDAVPPDVEPWPPAVVVDLRSEAEPDVEPPWARGTDLRSVPLLPEAAPDRLPTSLAGLYGHLLDVVPDRVTGLLPVVAHADGPVLLHCAAGKDRTGVTVAALLLLAGVEPDAVAADYTATTANMPALMDRLRTLGYDVPDDERLPRELVTAPPEAIAVVVDRLTGHDGGPEGWFVEHGADPADVDRWRRRITGP